MRLVRLISYCHHFAMIDDRSTHQLKYSHELFKTYSSMRLHTANFHRF